MIKEQIHKIIMLFTANCGKIAQESRVINWPDDWCLKLSTNSQAQSQKVIYFHGGRVHKFNVKNDKISQSEISNQY